MKTADVAVIVPVYNRAITVLATLRSIASQSLRPRGLIVVDDGSTDSTAARVQNWIDSQSGRLAAELISQENLGVSAARNRGIAAAADCAYLAFLDSDDVWPPDFLERMYPALLARPEAVAATCDRVDLKSGKGFARVHRCDLIGKNAAQYMLTHAAAVNCNSLFRASAIRQLGCFDEALRSSEDAKLYLPLSLLGPWVYVPGAPVIIGKRLAEARGEAAHLSLTSSGDKHRLASICEAFVLHGGGQQAVSKRVWSPRLASLWSSAAGEALRAGRLTEAHDYCGRSLQYHAWSPKAWARLALAYGLMARCSVSGRTPLSSRMAAVGHGLGPCSLDALAEPVAPKSTRVAVQ